VNTVSRFCRSGSPPRARWSASFFGSACLREARKWVEETLQSEGIGQWLWRHLLHCARVKIEDRRGADGADRHFLMKKTKPLNLNFRAIPWPLRADRLFKADSDWWHNAHKDPEAINFRYPVTKRSKGGQPTLPTLPFLSRVGIRNFYMVMQRLDSFFMAQIDGIDYLRAS